MNTQHVLDTCKHLECLTSLKLFPRGWHADQVFEVSDDVLCSKLQSFEISMALRSDQSFRNAVSFSAKQPNLERLTLSSIRFNSDSGMIALAEYIATSDTLSEVDLSFFENESSVDLNSFLIRVAKSTIVFLSIETKCSRSRTLLSLDTLVKCLESLECIARLTLGLCLDKNPDHASQKNQLRRIVDTHPSLSTLNTPFLNQRRERKFKAADLAICLSDLIKNTRALVGCKPKKKAVLPAEIILIILKYSIVELGAISSSRLNLIMKCLLDRRTVGLVYTEQFKLSVPILYTRCARALKRLP